MKQPRKMSYESSGTGLRGSVVPEVRRCIASISALPLAIFKQRSK